jgi:hypothetical protein
MCVCLRADLKPRDNGEQNTDPAQVKPDNIREVIRLSELYLDGIIRFAIAADARALSLSGMFAGATTALAAGGLTLLLTRGLSLVTVSLAVAAFTASGGFFFGLLKALSAVQPAEFNVAGSYLEAWNSADDLSGPLAVAQLAQAKIYQEQIEENQQSLLRSTSYIDTALGTLKWTPIITLATGAATYAIGYALTLCRM